MIYIAGAVVIALLLLALWLVIIGLNRARQEVTKGKIQLVGALRRAEEAEAKALVVAGTYLKKREQELRADAIKRSEAVVKGKVAEQLVPFTEAFGYAPRDCRFLGSPVDFIAFEGMSDGEVDRIVFIEVKTGLSSLSKRERQVRDAVDQGEVYYEEIRV